MCLLLFWRWMHILSMPKAKTFLIWGKVENWENHISFFICITLGRLSFTSCLWWQPEMGGNLSENPSKTAVTGTSHPIKRFSLYLFLVSTYNFDFPLFFIPVDGGCKDKNFLNRDTGTSVFAQLPIVQIQKINGDNIMECCWK